MTGFAYSGRNIEADNVSAGWLGACAAFLAIDASEANHLLIRMQDPLPEDASVRADAERFLTALGCQPIDEVRNTIFPAEVAADLPEPADLSAEYRELYDFIKRLGSPHGTYFGRMCAYPGGDDQLDEQLAVTASKLSRARSGKRWKATYEINIYSERKDGRKQRGFPCMSHLAFQLDGDRLDCLATYRSHDLILKGYGNYLGVAELQRYLAAATGFHPGELSVLAGHAVLDLSRRRRDELRELIAAHA
jgi:hypothetical protein